VERPGTSHLLVLTAPTLCADSSSLLVVLGEVLQLAAGGAAEQFGEPFQYADYAEWRAELLLGEDDDAEDARAYWSEQGALEVGTPTLLFGARFQEDGALAPSHVPIEVEPDVLAALEQAAAAAGVPEAVVLEAAWHATVGRLTGDGVVALASVLDGRSAVEIEGAVGLFAAAVCSRCRIDDGSSFAEIVDQAGRARSEGARWLDYQSASVAAAASRRLGLAFSSIDRPPPEGARILALRDAPQRFSLKPSWWRTNGSRQGELAFDSKLYSAEDASRIAKYYGTLLASAAENPRAQVEALTLVPPEEPEVLAGDVTSTSIDLSAILVHHAVEEQARRAPESTAVTAAGAALTYAELNESANRLARFLRARGIGRNATVGLCTDRSVEMVVSLLGILKAGGAYVPLNFEHPPARLAHQLHESGAQIVLTKEALTGCLAGFDGEVVCVDRDRATLESFDGSDVERVSEPGDLVYVMYTSGSTGLPKGVAVTHGNLANYTAHMVGKLEAGSEPLQFAAVSAISTDLGNTCVFPSLASGGTLHLIAPEVSMDGALVASYFDEHAVDVLKITPSHLRALLAGADADRVMPRRWLVLGGEAASWELVGRLQAAGGKCRILNHYGPTETTVGSCTFDVGTDVSTWRPATVPIGRPISNTRVYVLDHRLQPVPVGVAGELYIAGAGVAQGYVNQPEQTAEQFVPELHAEDGNRMYRTGDLARFLPDGTIEFLGRADGQVKIRGYRVEPAEIEAVLCRHPSVRQAAVVARQADDGEPVLVAYVVVSAEPSAEELQAYLSDSLPAYMVPARFARLQELPLTPSGKIDRRALPEPDDLERTAEYVAPRTPLEQGLAGIWEEVLGVEQVGVDDDFFALGGHSLLATQVVIRIRKAYADIPLHSIFDSPTVAKLADVVLGAELLAAGDGEG
jgi:amino acid adenylation domain-containing protein